MSSPFVCCFKLLIGLVVLVTAYAQQDPLQEFNTNLREKTGMFGLTFEERTRWEQKDGVNFGKAVNQEDMLSRIRIGADFQPVGWLKISAMGQDSRIPFYGVAA